jgi:hypothetical protein
MECGGPVASPDVDRKESGIHMAKIIEFYIPNTFRKKVAWIPPEQRGKVIEFCLEEKKSA